jgi:L-ascorbate metabolism protein UlaG (beta-lactamase superfamily)
MAEKHWKMRSLRLASGAFVMTLAVLLHSTGCMASFGARPRGERLERIRQSPQWDQEQKIFVNSVETTVMQPGKGWETTREMMKKPSDSVPDGPLPVSKPSFASPPLNGLRLTWFGHSAFLVTLDGINVLIDPVFAERASPSQLVGPRRFHPLPIEPSELPRLDAIIISHDHYDHLDMRAVRELTALSEAPFLVPLGVGAHLARWKVPSERIIEMDWWEEMTVGEVTIAATPARHFSGRGLFDRFTTLWASWAFVGPRHRVYFSGDTGFFDGFADISRVYGPFDVAMFEIGAYNPSWSEIHLGPHGAIAAFEMMDAHLVVPIHWGTFDLGLHGWQEPIETFVQLANQSGHRWAAPEPGGFIEPGIHEPREPWWR